MKINNIEQVSVSECTHMYIYSLKLVLGISS